MRAPWRPPAEGGHWIASIGHSDHDLDAFFALLGESGVVTLVDVRSLPRSRVAHFDKDALASACRGRGVAYHHLPGLGGKRAVPYAEHMATPDGQRAYERLRELGLESLRGGGPAAFMCVERDPAHCHRRHIAKRLEKDGWRVRHILPDAMQARLY